MGKLKWGLRFLLIALLLFGLSFLAGRFIRNKISADSVSYFPPGCQQTCPTIHVSCETSQYPTQTTETGSCSITIPEAMCTGQGLSTGDYSYSQFTNINQCKSYSGEDTLNNAQNCCAIRGMMTKACTPPNGSPMMPKCNDVKADNSEQACYKDTMDYYCDPNNPKVDIGECQAHCQDDMTRMAPTKIMNACMCEEGNDENEQGVDSDSCCRCLDECKNLKRVNEQVYPKYCQIGAAVTQERLNDACETMIASKCDSFNQDSKRYANGQLVDATCHGGTMFDKRLCEVNSIAAPYLNTTNTSMAEELSNQYCGSKMGSSFDYMARLKTIGLHNCIPRQNGQTCEASGLQSTNCPDGFCSDASGGWSFSCIKIGCNYSQGPIINGSSTGGGNETVVGIVKKADASTPLSGVKIKVQKQTGPYSIIGDNLVKDIGVTSNSGAIYFSLSQGAWNIVAEKSGYQTTTQSLVVSNSVPPTLNLSMIPEGQTPTASPTVSVSTNNTINLHRGFNTLGFDGSALAPSMLQAGMYLFGFNSLENKWDVSGSSQPASFQANRGYYIYSPADTNINQPSVGQTDSQKSLRPGWNLLWNEQVSNISDLRYTIINRQGQCLAKNVSLSDLKIARIIYSNVFVIQSTQSSDACAVFSLLTGVDKLSPTCSTQNPILPEVSQISAKKAYWVYLFENSLNSSILNSATCSN